MLLRCDFGKKGIGLKTQIESRSSSTQSQNYTPQSHKQCHPVGFVSRSEMYAYEEQKCNPKTAALHPHEIYNTKAFWGTWHRGLSTGTITADTCLAPSKSTEKQNTDSKLGRLTREEHTDTFSHGPRAVRRLVMPWQPPSASPLAGTGGIWGQQGQCLPSHVPTELSAQGSCLNMPRKTPCRDVTANKPNRRGFSHYLHLGLSDVQWIHTCSSQHRLHPSLTIAKNNLDLISTPRVMGHGVEIC